MNSLSSSSIVRISAVVVVILLAGAVRVHRLGHDSFWIDEVYQIRVASQPVSDIIRNYTPDSEYGTRDQAPLSFVITHFFVSDTNAEFRARLPSAVFGTLSVLALFVFARQLVGFWTSLLAMGFLALSPLHVWYSQEARWYALWGLLTTMSYVVLVQAWRRHAWRSWFAYGVLTAASILTFIYAGFVVASQAVSLWWLHRFSLGSRRSLVAFVLVMICVALVCSQVVVMVVEGTRSGLAYSGTPRSSSLLEVPYTFLVYAIGFTLGPTVSELHFSPSPANILREYPEVLLVLVAFVPACLLGLMRALRDPGQAAWLLPWIIVLPGMNFLVGLMLPAMTFQVRYTFAALPPFMVILAVGVSSLNGWLRWLSAAGIVAFSCVSLSNLYWNDAYDKADARGAMAYVESSSAGPKQVATVGQIIDAMPHYAKGPEFIVVRGCGTPDGVEKPLDLFREIWVVSGRDWDLDAQRCLDDLAQTHSVADHRVFPGVEVWHLIPQT